MFDAKQRLAYFPASFFGMIMGITGLSIAFLSQPGSAQGDGELWRWVGSGVLGIVSMLFAVLLLVYLLKIVREFSAVKAEWMHPVKMNFVPAISISAILLSIAYWHVGLPEVSFWLWALGAAMHLSLTLWVLSQWIHHDFFLIEHSNPAWFIPIVGNILVPIAGVHHAPVDISWFFFAIGIVFWPVFTAILFNRIIFHPPIVEKLIPTLFIFIAPPAVGFISYEALNGGVLDGFSRVLYGFALFMTLVMLVSAGKFLKLSFAISFWAYTFPLAAMSIASFRMATLSGTAVYSVIGWVVLVLLSGLIALFAWKTLQAVWHHKICTAEH
ncbi:MAG: SLAC1 anion channel family protein [Hydrogenovibrio sp.]